MVNNFVQCWAAPRQQLLSIVHGYSRAAIVVQSLLTNINKLVSSTIVGSCSNNIVTTIVLCQHRRTTDRTISIVSTLSIQQMFLNLHNSIVQALFSEKNSTNPVNFCVCSCYYYTNQGQQSLIVSKIGIIENRQ